MLHFEKPKPLQSLYMISHKYQTGNRQVIIYGGGWHRREIGWVDKIFHKINVG